jgi:hypothetical protein
MSPYQIGTNSPTLSASFDDDASIEDAFYLYHYGVDGWDEENPTTIPLNSIEGRISNFDQRITSVASQVSASAPYLKKNPGATSNTITPTQSDITPLYISSIFANFQEWQNSGQSPRAIISGDRDASFAFLGYCSIVASLSSSIAQNIEIVEPGHNGIVIKSASSQTANIQEWQNSQGLVRAYIDSNGKVGQSKTIITKTSNFTLGQSDNKKIILSNSSSKIIVTVPDNSTAPISTGTTIDIIRYGTGDVEFISSPSAEIISESNKNSISGRYASVTIVKTETNQWHLYGGLKTL